jgi:hypothetical protein
LVELHLVSRLADRRVWDLCRARSAEGATVEVVLMHDAVLETESSISETLGDQDGPKVAVMACAEDARRRQVEERWALIDYAGIIDRCAAAEKVTSW